MAPDGIFFYSNCMMDDQTVEIDTRTFEVSQTVLGRTGPRGSARRDRRLRWTARLNGSPRWSGERPGTKPDVRRTDLLAHLGTADA